MIDPLIPNVGNLMKPLLMNLIKPSILLRKSFNIPVAQLMKNLPSFHLKLENTNDF